MWQWLNRHEGWKAMLAVVYAVICIFDFIIVPSWIGITRAARAQSMIETYIADFQDVNPQVQLELTKILTYQHDPFTLKGGGMFHLSFGALLTGSAVARRKTPDDHKE